MTITMSLLHTDNGILYVTHSMKIIPESNLRTKAKANSMCAAADFEGYPVLWSRDLFSVTLYRQLSSYEEIDSGWLFEVHSLPFDDLPAVETATSQIC